MAEWVCARTGGREVPASIRAGRASRSVFSVVFSETCLNTGWDLLESPGPTCAQLALSLQLSVKILPLTGPALNFWRSPVADV